MSKKKESLTNTSPRATAGHAAAKASKKKLKEGTMKLDKQSKILKKASTSKKETLKKVSEKLVKQTRAAHRGASMRSGEVGRAPRSGFREVGKLPDHHFKQVKVMRGLAGLGLFAEKPIKKGEMIIEYIGNILTKEEADKDTKNQYLFEINRNKTIDGSPKWNLARYCNHACEAAANAESDVKGGRVIIKALKQIKEGEEITYDYGEEFVLEHIAPHGCNCAAKKHGYGMGGVGESK